MSTPHGPYPPVYDLDPAVSPYPIPRYPAGPSTPGTGPNGERFDDPESTLGIVGLVLALFCGLPGLIVSLIALNNSKRRGYRNTIALVGAIIGGVGTLLPLVYLGFLVLLLVA
ncbi:MULTISPECIES: DUF4190 domain-containing protein [Tsukamurella]|uniref:DUF4190 domain-containing protein n=1 Tax=Tsukamurella strandjordii TaxID=147577 RepID=A0AA90NE24_9ACTN|nr:MULTISPECIES: DUF4190 domain-containing protein [Tsukamurella]MDP0396705.1 DUF4190 domain-containing protein [Tsukamurella strandjordii]GIZ96506.1 hypothetical protein TTY48_11180 [Tsukamurella sp. TY48]